MFLQLIYFSGKIFKYLKTSNQLLNLRGILTFKVLIFTQTQKKSEIVIKVEGCQIMLFLI